MTNYSLSGPRVWQEQEMVSPLPQPQLENIFVPSAHDARKYCLSLATFYRVRVSVSLPRSDYILLHPTNGCSVRLQAGRYNMSTGLIWIIGLCLFE